MTRFREMCCGGRRGGRGVPESLVSVVKWMVCLFRGVWREGRIPEGWRYSHLVPIYKGKGDPLSCGSYRAIKLLEHVLKVFEKVVGGGGCE